MVVPNPLSSLFGRVKPAIRQRITSDNARPQVNRSIKSVVFLTPITWPEPIIPEEIPPPFGF